MDEEARKQLLLARIAHERMQWNHDVEVLRIAASPKHIASNALRSVLPAGLERAVFGSPDGRAERSLTSNLSHRLLHLVLFVRRYPLLLSIAGGLLARRAIRRILVVGAVGAGVAAGTWYLRQGRH